jgi:hypothetical protein
MATRHYCVSNMLTNFVTAFVCRNLIADVFQRSRHVGYRILIKLCQQFSYALPEWINIDQGSNTAPSIRGSKKAATGTQRSRPGTRIGAVTGRRHGPSNASIIGGGAVDNAN